MAGAVHPKPDFGDFAPHRGAHRRDTRGNARGRRQGRRCRSRRVRQRSMAAPVPLRADGEGREAGRGLRRSHGRDGRPDHRGDGHHAQLQQARTSHRCAGPDAPCAGNRSRVSLGREAAGLVRRSPRAPGPGRRRRRDRAVERPSVLDHAQADPGPDRRLHRRRQARARNAAGCAVAGRNARRSRPARRRGVDHSRRPRDRGSAGPPSGRGQDLVHRVLGDRSPHRRDLRRAAQAGQPGARRQIGGDHPRRRRYRAHRQEPEDGKPDEQRAGVRGPDPDPGQRAAPRRGRRRARRDDVGSCGRRPRRRSDRRRSSRRATPAASRAGLHPGRARRRGADRRRWHRQAVRPRLVCPADVVRGRDQRDEDRPRRDLRPGVDGAEVLRRA